MSETIGADAPVTETWSWNARVCLGAKLEPGFHSGAERAPTQALGVQR